MINGKGLPDNSSGITSLDPFMEFLPWIDPKLDERSEDASPTLSNYSSADGSEFERYCSANSALGTASLCSSVGNYNDFLGSDLGSSKHLGFGVDDTGLEDYGLLRRFDRSVSGVYSSSNVGAESHRESVNPNTGILSDEWNSFPRFANKSSVPLCTSSSGTGSAANNEVLQLSRVGDASTPSWTSEKMNSSYLNVCQESTNDNLTSSSAGRGLVLVSSNSGNTSLHSNGKTLLSSSDGNGSQFLEGSHENVFSDIDCGEDKTNANSVPCFQGGAPHYGAPTEGKEVGTVPVTETAWEVAPGFEHSDDEGSMLSYDTDKEDSIHVYERRNMHYLKETKFKNENLLLINSAVAFGSDDWDEFEQETNNAPIALNKSQLPQEGHLESENLWGKSNGPCLKEMDQKKNVREVPLPTSLAQPVSVSSQTLKGSSAVSFLSEEKSPPRQKSQAMGYSKEEHSDPAKNIMKDDAGERILQCICSKEIIDSGKECSGKSDSTVYPLSSIVVGQVPSIATKASQGKEVGIPEDYGLKLSSSITENSPNISLRQLEEDSATPQECGVLDEIEKFDAHELYEEMVHDMEIILLDSGESHAPRFLQSDRGYLSPCSQPFRDGSSTASTSGTDDPCPSIRYLTKIDWIEVVGAKQERGDVSFGERLVGVKEYTVYRIKVWSAKDQWEVERRYRDFFTLYRQMKTFFREHGLSLPSPWASVERESRKIFGNVSPNVVSERSFLIQECLQSILKSGSSLGTPSCLVWFLSPSMVFSNSSGLNSLIPHSMQKLPDNEDAGTFTEGSSNLGRTISLLVEIQPHKSTRQLLEAQNCMCAGCHQHFESRKTYMREFVQAFGWGKPRLCEYTGQLFCISCHTNDTAVLPAKVLHLWDFSLYPVSQLANAYLESIYDQPMLCVSAVNPFLFSKVPALLHVTGIRKKIGVMFPYIRCPFRRTIQKSLGPRRYLLESNEFFALRDLVDLSKGAFAVLPMIVQNVLGKILEHITQQCLVCCDVGIPCGARQACEDPSSLIFPFQEDEITRCRSCNSALHKHCYQKLTGCPCGTPAEIDDRVAPLQPVMRGSSDEKKGAFDMSMRIPEAKSTIGFFTDMFSKAKQEMTRRPTRSNPVILMGSLPHTSM